MAFPYDFGFAPSTKADDGDPVDVLVLTDESAFPDACSSVGRSALSRVGKQFVRQLENFFVDYHKLSGEQYRVLGWKGPDQARKLVKSGMR